MHADAASGRAVRPSPCLLDTGIDPRRE